MSCDKLSYLNQSADSWGQSYSKSLILFLIAIIMNGCSAKSDTASVNKSYYVDSANGNDNNSGQSSSDPWRSLSKISSSSFESGTTIYLKRGEIWYEELEVPNSDITIDAYGSGATPIIDGSTSVTSWNSLGGGIYSATLTLNTSEALGNISQNGIMMRFSPWTGDVVSSLSGAPQNSYSYDYALSTLYIKTDVDPATALYRASVKLYGISATTKSHISIHNMAIHNFSLHGIAYKNCNDCSVYDTVVSQGGGATINSGVYAGNGIEFGNSSSAGLVDGVSVSDIFDSCISPQTYDAMQSMSNIVIRNSTLTRCGFAGVEVSVLDNGGAGSSQISGVELSNLTISDIGYGWSGQRYGTTGNGVQIKADTNAGLMSNISLTKVTVSHSAGSGIVLGGEIGHVLLQQLNINDSFYGLSIEEPIATTLGFSLYSSLIHHNHSAGIFYNSPTADGFTLYQNTISDNGGINLAISSLSQRVDIRNNIFSSTSGITDIYIAGPITGSTINYNCYYDHANMFGYNGSAYASLSLFSSSSGFELLGTSGDQGIVDPGVNDYTLAPTSVCISSGEGGLGIINDYSDYTFSTPPSSGALQYHL